MRYVTARRSRGFMHMLEAVLAIMVLYLVLNQMQIVMASRYSDYSNVPRLYRFAKDLGLAICGNENSRPYFANNTLPPANLTWWDTGWAYRATLLMNGSYYVPFDLDAWTERTADDWAPYAGSTVTNDVNYVTRGIRSIKIVTGSIMFYTNGGATYDLKATDATKYDTVEFDVNATSASLKVIFTDLGGKTATYVIPYSAGILTHVKAPVAAAGWTLDGGFNWRAVRYLSIEGAPSSTYYIDGVHIRASMRRDEPIDYVLTAPQTVLTNCTREVRVVKRAGNTEVPSQVYNETTGGGNRTCNVVFMADLFKNRTTTYYVYYGNPTVTAPTYSTDIGATYAPGSESRLNNSAIGIRFKLNDANLLGEIDWAGSPTFVGTNFAKVLANEGGFASTKINTAGGWAMFGLTAGGGGMVGTNPAVGLKNAGPVFAEFERNNSFTVATAFDGDFNETFRVYRNVPLLYTKFLMNLKMQSTIMPDAACGGRFHETVTNAQSLMFHQLSNKSFTTVGGGSNAGTLPADKWVAENANVANTTGYAQFAWNWSNVTYTSAVQHSDYYFATGAPGAADFGTIGTARLGNVVMNAGTYSWRNAFYLSLIPNLYFNSNVRDYYGRFASGPAITVVAENLTTNLAWAVPPDIDYHVYLYNGSGSYQLRTLVDDEGTTPPEKPLAAFSCLNSGWSQTGVAGSIKTYAPSRCRCSDTYIVARNCTPGAFVPNPPGPIGPDWEGSMTACTVRLTVPDLNNPFQRNETHSNFSMWFAVPYQQISNATLLLWVGVTGPTPIQIWIHNKSTGALELVAVVPYNTAHPPGENQTFDLTAFLPDYYGNFNMTVAIAPAPARIVDYMQAILNVTPIETISYYNPMKVTVRTWNRNG